jgi:hypothetical protein
MEQIQLMTGVSKEKNSGRQKRLSNEIDSESHSPPVKTSMRNKTEIGI